MDPKNWSDGTCLTIGVIAAFLIFINFLPSLLAGFILVWIIYGIGWLFGE